MADTTKPRQRAVQDRTLRVQRQIAEGAINVLSKTGVAGVTHRAVAKEAGVSLAATTRHYSGKIDILNEASRLLLTEYLQAFSALEDRLTSNSSTEPTSLDDLVFQVTLNALTRDRARSIAWWEIILFGGRTPDGQHLSRNWFRELDEIWFRLADHLADRPNPQKVRLATDRAIGLIFLLHPLHLDRRAITRLLSGLDVSPVFDWHGESPSAGDVSDTKKGRTKAALVNAGIEVLIEDGPGAVSHRAVGERTGMVRSGPSYYFPSIDTLLEAAQIALFERAKQRYREGVQSFSTTCDSVEQLTGLSTSIFLREAVDYRDENLAYFTVWIAAGRNPNLRGFVRHILADQSNAWLRRMREVRGPMAPVTLALANHAIFAGKLARALATGSNADDLADVEEDFRAAIDEN